MATVDLQPQGSALNTASAAAFTLQADPGDLEDGPEGERAPNGMVVRGFGDDMLGAAGTSVPVAPVRHLDIAHGASRPSPPPTHSPCAGPPTGPPLT